MTKNPLATFRNAFVLAIVAALYGGFRLLFPSDYSEADTDAAIERLKQQMPAITSEQLRSFDGYEPGTRHPVAVRYGKEGAEVFHYHPAMADYASFMNPRHLVRYEVVVKTVDGRFFQVSSRLDMPNVRLCEESPATCFAIDYVAPMTEADAKRHIAKATPFFAPGALEQAQADRMPTRSASDAGTVLTN